MRPLLALFSMSMLSSVAFAEGTPPRAAPARPAPSVVLTAIDSTTIPEKCQPQLVEARNQNLTLALAARQSLANCVAQAKLATLALCDCHESVIAIAEATAPSFALLDEVIANGDDLTKIIAEQAKADLYTNMAIRMLATLPSPGGSEATMALHRSRKEILEAQLAPWREQAALASERILERASGDPRLARNPVVASAVRTSKDRLRGRTAAAVAASSAPPAATAPAEPATTDATVAPSELR